MTPQILTTASAALVLAMLGSCASGGKSKSAIARGDGPSVKVAGPTEIEPYTPLTVEQQAKMTLHHLHKRHRMERAMHEMRKEGESSPRSMRGR